MLPERDRRELNEGKESTLYTGLHRVRSEVIDRLKPDLIVVFDSHWFTTVEFCVAAQARRTGRFTSDELPRGMASVPYDVAGDPEFAHALAAAADDIEDCWITAISDEHLPIHYGTVNLLGFLQGDERWVTVSARPDRRDRGLPHGRARASRARSRGLTAGSSSSARGAEPHLLAASRAARARGGRRAAHLHQRGGAADHEVLDAWVVGDHAAVIDAMPEYLRFRPEGRFGHYLRRRGDRRPRVHRAAGVRTRPTRTRSGLARSTSVFEPPAGGWTA